MENKGKILCIVLTFFGTIILLAAALFAYLWIKNPLNIREAIFSKKVIENYDHPLLNEEQEKILNNLGIDTSALPTTVTPEMEKCMVEKLGASRVDAIKKGSPVGTADLLKAKSCL